MKFCCLFSLVAVAAATLDPRDLQRAKQKVPRAGWKGSSMSKMSSVLNGHLQKMFPKTKPCTNWTAQELQELQAVLYKHRHEGLNEIYVKSMDNRRLRLDS